MKIKTRKQKIKTLLRISAGDLTQGLAHARQEFYQ
jgi:hypothetical protein